MSSRSAEGRATSNELRPSPVISGTVAPGFEPVRVAFEANWAEWGEVGATCCVYVDGSAVVDLAGGWFAPDSDAPYTADTLQLVASATKGAVAICALRLAERGELDLDAPVSEYWSEFAAAGKQDIPVRWLLSHRAGLPKVDVPLTLEQIYQGTPLVEALAAQEPVWEPGTAHGYHALTYGTLVGEVLSRITGLSPGELIKKEITEALGTELWVGLPPELNSRVSPLVRSCPDPATAFDPLLQQLADPSSLAHASFFIEAGFVAALSDPSIWRVQVPAGNGIGNARALARMYAACVGEVDGVRLLSSGSLAAGTTRQSHGVDRVLTYETNFGVGLGLPWPGRDMCGLQSNCFGHYGLGGSTGFADLDRGFTFGYVVNQMRSSSATDPRSAALIEAVIGCV